MDIEQIKQKLQNKESLSVEEARYLFEKMQEDVEKLKQEQPEVYLKLLAMLTEATQELNKEIKELLS